MAAEAAPMTPEAAISLLGETRVYRQRMTSRAAGIIWIVWGAALAMLALADLTLVMGVHAGIAFSSAWMMAFTVAFVAIGAGLTNMVWRAHALERDASQRGWIAWATAALLVVGTVVSVPLIDALVYDPMDWQTPTRISPFLFLVIDGALALAILMRKHVAWIPGVLAAGSMLALEVAMTIVDVPRTPENELLWGLAMIIDILVIYGAVGLWHYVRG